ncbi:MAG: metallophosphoesterase, partial [Gammaproteobacteria bacterium]|nr:metallophosphoesterase [Gammaproteobacteria bacterium]
MSAPAPAAVPPGTRLYAVGDVHGEALALTCLMERIREDAEDAKALRRVLVLLGDYVDRGPDSRRVIDLLLNDPAPGFETRFIRGNHDAWLLAFLDNPSSGFEWLNAGGQATLLSYGASAPPGPRTP